MNYLENKKALSNHKKVEAQTNMRELKSKLLEFKRFDPSIDEAINHLISRYNSNSIKSDWYSHLYDADISIL